MAKHVIQSWDEAKALAPAILEQLRADPPLLLAALSNPALAVEALGYEIAPAVRDELTTRSRFSKRDAARVHYLEREIFKQAGERFDLKSAADVERVLFGQLKLSRPYEKGKDEDPLEALRGKHPVVDLLLEYRRLDASVPGLAPRKLFDEIRAGKHRLPLSRIEVRFKPRQAAEPLGDDRA